MLMRILLVLGWLMAAAGAAVPVPPAHAQEVDPRIATEEIAAAIEENFYDAERGTEIAADLRREAAAGTYGALTEPYALASALSRRLAPLDGHFRVNWTGAQPSGDAAAPGPAFAPEPEYSWQDIVRRNGWGFAAAEILPGNIGYIEMSNFANIDFDDPADPARRAADAALALTAAADALIIDLRENGGGAPSMVGYLASAFTPADADIYNVFHSRQGTTSEAPGVYYPQPDLERPVYVLTSARTASAGEALPYTLQAAERATIVGEATAGGANPGGTIDTASGFSIFVSSGSPINPVTGGNWEGTGVQPDVAVPADEALLEAQRLALRQVVADGDAGTDSRWALEALDARRGGAVAGQSGFARYAGDYGDYRLVAADGTLRLQRGKHPVRQLLPLGEDLFYDAETPTTRYRFLGDGRAPSALEVETAYGWRVREQRTGG